MRNKIFKLFLVLMLIVCIFVVKTKEVKADLTSGLFISYTDGHFLNYRYDQPSQEFIKDEDITDVGDLDLDDIPNLDINFDVVNGIPQATLTLSDDITLYSTSEGTFAGCIIASRMPLNIIGNNHTINFVCSPNPNQEYGNDATAIEGRNHIYIENATLNFYKDELEGKYFSTTSDKYDGIIIETTDEESVYSDAPHELYIKNTTINSYGSSFINTSVKVNVTLDNTKANVIVGAPDPSSVRKASRIYSNAFEISETLILTNESKVDVYAEYKNQNSSDGLLFEEDFVFEPIASVKNLVIEKNSSLKINNPRNNVMALLGITGSINVTSSSFEFIGGLVGIIAMSKGGKDKLFLEEKIVNGPEKEDDVLPRNIQFNNADVTMTNLLCNIFYMPKRVDLQDGEGIEINKSVSNHNDIFKIIGLGPEDNNPLEEEIGISVEQSFYLPDDDMYFNCKVNDPLYLAASLDPNKDISEYEAFDSSKINQYKAFGILGVSEDEPEQEPEEKEEDHHHHSHNDYLIPQTGIK